MRLAGQMLQEADITSQRQKNLIQNSEVTSDDFDKPTLSSLGITKNESSTYQKNN